MWALTFSKCTGNECIQYYSSCSVALRHLSNSSASCASFRGIDSQSEVWALERSLGARALWTVISTLARCNARNA